MIVLGSSPPCRWIVNFDVDFMDGLVLAALVGAHVPFVVCYLILDLYSQDFCFFQCLKKIHYPQEYFSRKYKQLVLLTWKEKIKKK